MTLDVIDDQAKSITQTTQRLHDLMRDLDCNVTT
jgi:hypothetical protein